MHGKITELAEATRGKRNGRSAFVFRRGPDGRTFLFRQYTSYPFHICRPHYFVGDPPGMATLYLQSVAGGIFESDRLEVQIAAEPNAELHVTSQAATIVHGMERNHAEQSLTIEAGEGAFVECLPDPTILFPKAKLSTRLRIHAHETATVLAADAFLAHDPDGRAVMFDWLANDFSVVDDSGYAVVRDRFRVTGDLLARALPGVNGTWSAQATVIVVRRNVDVAPLLETVRCELDLMPDVYAGASELPGKTGIGVRILAADGHALRSAMLSVWSSARIQAGMPKPSVRRK